jgi:hypothetical protein
MLLRRTAERVYNTKNYMFSVLAAEPIAIRPLGSQGITTQSHRVTHLLQKPFGLTLTQANFIQFIHEEVPSNFPC